MPSMPPFTSAAQEGLPLSDAVAALRRIAEAAGSWVTVDITVNRYGFLYVVPLCNGADEPTTP
jgi:hypothetical protein